MKISGKAIGAVVAIGFLAFMFALQLKQARQPPPAVPTVTVTSVPTSDPYSGSSSSSTTLTPRKDGKDEVDHPLDEKAQQEILQRSRAFATDWSTPGTDAHEWVKRVRRHTVPDLAKKFEFIDVEAVPDTGKITKVTIEKATEPVATCLVNFEHGQRIRVAVLLSPGKGWKVLSFDRA